MALTYALIPINSHGITRKNTENNDMVTEYSVFFRVLPWRIGGNGDDVI